MNDQQKSTYIDDSADGYVFPSPPVPSAELRALDRLVGTWQVTGGAEGQVTYSWMRGGYFLIQRVSLEQFGQKIDGVELIGNLRPFGERPGREVMSRFYDSTGNTLDYVYELDGETLTIWAGAKGSAAKYVGTFADTGDLVAGEWEYPGGGGYAATMIRCR